MYKSGMNFDASVCYILNDNFAFGGRIGFNRFSLEGVSWGGTDVKVEDSNSILEFHPTAKISLPISGKIVYFIQPSIGLDLIIDKTEVVNISNSESEAGFGFAIETGMDISFFEIKPGFKFVAVEDRKNSKWFTVNAGIAF